MRGLLGLELRLRPLPEADEGSRLAAAATQEISSRFSCDEFVDVAKVSCTDFDFAKTKGRVKPQGAADSRRERRVSHWFKTRHLYEVPCFLDKGELERGFRSL